MALLFPNLRNFSLVSAILLSSYYAEKFWKHLHKYFDMSFVSSEGGTSKRKTQKKDIRNKTQDVLFSEKQVFQFCLLSVWDLLRLIPQVFCFEILTRHSPYCVYWFVVEFSNSNSFQKICNEFFIHHSYNWNEDLFLCETVWSFSNWILVSLSWNLSHFVPNSVWILP